MDLAQLLVKKQIAKYGGGTWILPQDVAMEELPSRAEELLSTRLAGLGSVARELAESLSIHSKPVALERCLRLMEGKAESETYAALDELVAEQILRSEAGSYRFAHDALRRAVAGNLDDARRRESHVRAAEALLASDADGVGARIEAALHLLDAGEESRGAEMLAKLGMGLTSAVDFNAGSEAVLALERALECFERQGRSEHEIAALLFPMMKLAYYSPHWRLVRKHGERALDIGLRITGLSAAHKLASIFRPAVALKIGLQLGARGFAKQQKAGLGYDIRTAIVASCGILPAVVGTAGTCLDTERVERIERIVAPLKLFGPGHVAGVLHNWAPMELLIVRGLDGEAREDVGRFLELNKAPHVKEAMGEANWKSQYGGLLFMRSLYDAYAMDDSALKGVEELEQLGIRVWAMVADQIRMLYHAFRGESDEVQRYRERVELFAVQGSTTWQVEMFWPAILLSAEVLTGDAIAARRTAEQITRRAKDVESLRKYAQAAQAAYLLLRGEIPQALALYEKILPEFPLRGSVAYERVRSHYAQALNLAGDHARAKAIALEAISGKSEADDRLFHFLEAYRQLALAEAGLGNGAEAIAILDRLLVEHGQKDNRLMVGLLHKARAEVALAAGDSGAFESHVREMEQRFRSTRNPALIAQCERLLDRAARLGMRKLEPLAVQDAETVQGLSAMVSGTVGDLSATVDPCAHALQLILTRAKAKSGFLYLRRQGEMQLAAASDPNPPPRSLEEALKELADKPPSSAAETEQWSSAIPASGLQSTPAISTTGAQSTTGSTGHTSDSDLGETAIARGLEGHSSLPSPAASDDDELGETQAISDAARTGNTVFLRSVPPPGPWGSYQLVLLDARQGERRVVIGGLILDAKPQMVARLSKQLLKGIAQILHDRQITSAFTSLEA